MSDCGLLIDHKANIKNGSKTSIVWDFGDKYVCLANPEHSIWRCRQCAAKITIPAISRSTSSAGRHLKDKHGITGEKKGLEASRGVKRTNQEMEESLWTDDDQTVISQLIQRVNVHKFRYYVLRWIAIDHVPFTASLFETRCEQLTKR